jgi:hypothetical protein
VDVKINNVCVSDGMAHRDAILLSHVDGRYLKKGRHDSVYSKLDEFKGKRLIPITPDCGELFQDGVSLRKVLSECPKIV